MTSRLDRLDALEKGATKGPWFDDGYGKLGADEHGIGELDEAADAALIAEARNLLPDLIAAARVATLVQECGDALIEDGYGYLVDAAAEALAEIEALP